MSDWPDEARPGVPLNPEHGDTWHWVDGVPLMWQAGEYPHSCRWSDNAGNHWPVWQVASWLYSGPCLTPAEVEERIAIAEHNALHGAEAAAREAAAFKRGAEAMREKAARVAAREKDRLWSDQQSIPPDPMDIVSGNRTERLRDAVAARAGTAAEIEAAISALPVPEDSNEEG